MFLYTCISSCTGYILRLKNEHTFHLNGQQVNISHKFDFTCTLQPSRMFILVHKRKISKLQKRTSHIFFSTRARKSKYANTLVC